MTSKRDGSAGQYPSEDRRPSSGPSGVGIATETGAPKAAAAGAALFASAPKGRWLAVRRWFQANSFAPSWMPDALGHPGVGYLLAVLLQVVAAALDLLLVQLFPHLVFRSSLLTLAVVLVALTWGAIPGLIATATGFILLSYVIISPHFSWTLAKNEQLVGLSLFLSIGVIISFVASRSQRARRNVEQATGRMRTLQFISDAALAHLTLDDLLVGLLDRLRAVLAADNSSILLLSEDGQELTARAVRGLGAERAHQVRIPLGQGVAGRIADSQGTLIIDDLAQTQTAFPFLKESFRSLVGTPLLVEGRVIGVLHVTAVLPHRFTQDDARLLELLAGRIALAIDHARLYEAEQRAHAEAAAHARELETIFDAIADGLAVYDRQGHIQRVNTTGRKVLGLPSAPESYAALSPDERATRLDLCDQTGQPLAPEQWPVNRALRGEVLTGDQTIDMLLRRKDGQTISINASTAPVRDAAGATVAAVIAFRDVTAQRRLEQRTREALDTLLAMAETLVQAPEEASPEALPSAGSKHIAQRLTELACSFLECQRMSIFVLEPGTGVLDAVAVTGLSPEQERFWPLQMPSLAEWPDPTIGARLDAGEAVLLDMTQPPFADQPNPFGIRQALLAPIQVGEHLIGMLALDYGGAEHAYTTEEIRLTEAVARLTGLTLERERLLRERAEAQANALALREANRQMDAFMGIASHELKTPLTTIRLHLQLMQRRLHQLQSQQSTPVADLLQRLALFQDQFTRTEYQTERLNRLVNDLLDVSRIQTGKLTIRAEPADLAAIITEAAAEQREANPDRALRLHLPEGQPVIISVDTERIMQVVTNYLTNALKYSSEEQPVDVGLEVEGAWARLWVRDQGPGLSLEQQGHLWERFYRAPGIEVQSGSGIGLGLGLYISRTIIAQHQGQVGMQSAPDQGSTFWFTLPLSPP